MTTGSDVGAALRSSVMEAGIELFAATTAEPLPSRGSFRHVQPRDVLPTARAIAVAGWCTLYEPRIVPSEPGRPRGRFTAYGSRVFEQMERHCVDVMTRALRSRGYDAVATDRLPIKPAVVRSGLGFYGKHSVTTTRALGSMVMFACVVTDAPLDGVDEPLQKTECEAGCSACIKACPTGAITAPYTVDRARCITNWLWGAFVPPDLRHLQKDRLFGCAECLLACPKNRHVRPKTAFPVAPDDMHDSPELIPLLTADIAHFKKVIPSFPLRAGLDALRGNAIIALGNIGDPAAVDALGETMRGGKARHRAYAAWALGRIGTASARGLIEEARRSESEAEVLSEIVSALAYSGR